VTGSPMAGTILLSTGYLPPVEYFFRIAGADEILIEREEDYVKQTYRNRCHILSSNGPHLLSVPVYLGSIHKTPIKEIRIDYSKRWQQVHLRALTAAYASAPFFIFYFDEIEKIIHSSHTFLLDKNMDFLSMILKILKLDYRVSYTTVFEPVNKNDNDLRYSISPKKKSDYHAKEYTQVFSPADKFVSGLSIIDLIFNMGPESVEYL